MIALDIDDKSLAFAQRNVERNGLEGRVKVLKVSGESEELLPLEVWRRCERYVAFRLFKGSMLGRGAGRG